MNRKFFLLGLTALIIGALIVGRKEGSTGQSQVVAEKAAGSVAAPHAASAKSLIEPASTTSPAGLQLTAPPAGSVVVAPLPPNAPEGVRDFRAWATKYFQAEPSQRQKLVEEGLKLAEAQRAAVKQLISMNPMQAIANAVPMVVRQDLPAAIVARLEQRVNAVGSLTVLGSLDTEGAGATGISRVFTAKDARVGESSAAYVYGSRANEHSLNETRVNGVAVDGDLAVADSRFRPLEVGERIDPNKTVIAVCPVSGKTSPVPASSSSAAAVVNQDTTAVEDNEHVVLLCAGGHMVMYGNQLANEEAGKPANRLKTLAEGSAGGAQTPFDVPVGWTTGTSTMLYLRLAFPDIMQEPRSEAEAYDTLRQVTDFYITSSFGRFYLTPTVAPLVVLPYPEQWYIASLNSQGRPNGYALLRAHAEEAAKRMGFDTSSYDLEVVDYKGGPNSTETASGWSGLGAVGGKGVWLHSLSATSVVGVLAHETGHNLGLSHSNRWVSATNPPTSIGPGQNEEYGNKFDVMGGANSPLGHFVSPHKYFINWLSPNQLHDVEASGTYRIYQVDQGQADADKRYALHVNKDSERDYWVEFRQNHTTIPALMNGVMLTWSPWGSSGLSTANNGSNGGAQLVDTTPGSVPNFNLTGAGASDTRDDAALMIGRTFADTDSNVYITPIAKGTTTPPYMDVVVNRGPFPGNHAPVLSINASTKATTVSGAVTLTATATDPDGDAIAYAWDFGDGTMSLDNLSRQVHTWTTSGRYFVTCTASDMKGMRTTQSLLITAGFTTGQSFTISGTIRDPLGNPLEGILVANRALVAADAQPNAATFHSAYTDSNGFYVLTNLPGSNTSVVPSQYPNQFSPTGSSTFNPLDQDQTDVDFNAIAPTDVVTITVNDGVATEGTADKATITLTRPANATGNLDIQFLDSSSGTARLGTDYTITASPTSAAITEVQVNGANVGTSRVRFAAAVTTAPTAPAVTSITLTLTAINDHISEGIEYAVLEFPDTTNTYPIIGPRTIVIPINDAQTTLPVVKIIADDPVASEAGKSATMRLERNGPTTGALDVHLAYSGVAVIGQDFTAPTVVTIPAGAASTTFTIPAIDDLEAEGTESATITVATNAAYEVDVDQGNTSFTITDNDQPALTIVASVPTTSEAKPTVPGKFTITRAAADISQPLTVEFSLGGSALPGQDYRRIEGIAVIPAYENSVDINIDPVDDGIDEPDQTVICRLSTKDTYAITAPGSATVTIQDNDSSQFTIQALGNGNGAVHEPSAAPAVYDLFAISRPAAGTAATVKYTVSGTATAGTDYQTLSGTVNFSPTDTSINIPVTIFNDNIKESTESIILTLQSGTGYRLGLETQATINIEDESSNPTVSVSLDDQTSTYSGITEPNGIGSVTLGSGGTGYATVPTVTITGAAGGTGTGATATAKINAGAVASVALTSAGTGYSSADLPLTVTITGGGGTGATATAALGTIVKFYFSRVGGDQTLSMDLTYALTGTATLNTDYTVASPTAITIPANQSGVFMNVAILPDLIAEGTETLTTTLTANARYSIGTNSATLYINDSDAYTGSPAPSVGFKASKSTVAERTGPGGSTLTIPVTLTGTPPAYPVTVEYLIGGGSATGSGIDYNFTPGSLTFTSLGPTTQNLVLTTVPDNVSEGDETVIIRLLHPTNANLGTTTHTVTITDLAPPEVFTDELTTLPTVSATPRGHVYTNTTGMVGSVQVVAGGLAYTSAPTVSFSGGGGNGAAATATVTAGIVTSIDVTSPGTGYTTAPTVTLTGGTGTGATAKSVLVPVSAMDGVGDIAVINGGTGYVAGPSVSFTGGGGSGAAATATVTGGVITGIVMTRPGSGYLTAPTVVITSGTGSGATATATVNAGVVTSVSVDAGGTSYPSPPVITLTGGGGTGATALATVSSGAISAITIVNPGSGYTSAPTVGITGGSGLGATAMSALSGTLVWFEWGTSASFGKTTTRQNAGFGGSSFSFADSIDTLPALLSYPGSFYYRAVAQNAFGITRGITRLTRTVAPPVATTSVNAGHTGSTVTVAGAVNPGRINGTYWFEYGSTTAYGSSTPTQVLNSTATSQTISSVINSLPQGTLVHYRSVIQTALGTAYGADMTVEAVPQQVAGDLLVSLDALQPSAGTASWSNQGGTQGGSFGASGAPALVSNVQSTGVPGVWFNGVTDYYSGPNAAADITGNDNRSIEVWVLNPGLATSDDIVSLGRDGALTGVTLAYNNDATHGAFRHDDGSNDAGYPALPALGQWHHLVYTYNGTKVAKLYVDGVLKVTKTLSANLATVADTIAIGTTRSAAGTLDGGNFNGYLNSLRIHGGELTAAQVTANYNLGPAVPAAAAPLAATKGASNLTTSTVTLNGVVVPQGVTTTAWVEWGTSTAYDNASLPQSVGSTWMPYNVAVPVTGLASGVEYHFHVVAKNSFGTTNGPDKVFTLGTIANAGILWVDLRATDATAGTSIWKNLGALGDFTSTGTVSVSPNVASAGYAGVTFDGTTSAYESIASADPDFAFQSDRTLEAWVLNPALNQASESVAHLGRRLGVRSSLQLSAGSADAWVAGTDTGAWSAASPATAPAAGHWHHLVLVFNSTTSTLDTYVDGALALSHVAATGWDTWDDPVLLGAARDSTGAKIWGEDGFSGSINTLRIHGGMLTAAQITANYNAGPATTSSGSGVAPLADTLPADQVTDTTATLHASVTPGGLATTAWIEWGESPGFGSSTPSVVLSTAFATQTLDFPIGGLTAGHTYTYQVVAKNEAGTTTSTSTSFVAGGSIANLPTATAASASAITVGKATLNGSAVVPAGSAGKAWFEYGTITNSVLAPGTKTTVTTVPAGTTKTLLAALTGLQPHASYWFRLVAQNDTGTVVSSILTFTSANTAPVATAGSVTIKENTATVLALKGTDADKEPVSVVITQPPVHGGLTNDTTLTPTYTPDPYYNHKATGTDTFKFKVWDGAAYSAEVAFTITITPVDNPPNGVDSVSAVQVNENSSVGSVGLSAVDPDGDAITSFAKATNAAHGTVTVTSVAGAGSFSYTPAANFFGQDQFTFTASNAAGTGKPGTITINVNEVYVAAVAVNSSAAGAKNAVITGTGVVTNPNGYTLTYSQTGSPQHGTLNSFSTTTGAWNYTPATDFTGSDAFTFNVDDGTATSNTATVTLNIGGPVASDASFTGVRDDLLTGTLTATDPNVSPTLTFAAASVPQHGTLTVNDDGTFRYQPAPGFMGTDSFAFVVNDGTAASNTATATLLITERPPQWVWVQGANVAKKSGVYGVKGTPSATNMPGARSDSASWTDSFGDVWVFGGSGYASGAVAGLLNDLWERDAVTGQWIWQKGSTAINAAGTYGAQGLVDASNTPGARSGAVTWVSGGKFWMFGGTGHDSTATGNGLLNDLWCFDPVYCNWTWIKGSNFINSNGQFGTQRVAASTNAPSARSAAAGWVDGSGKLWMFGGNGRAGTGTVIGNLGDLWNYDPLTNQWTWISGSSSLDTNGVYGTLGIASATTSPGARSFATAWSTAGYDDVNGTGSFYLFGGVGRAATGTTKGSLNDLWRYDTFRNTWSWISGASTLSAAGVYGTLEVANGANHPGARSDAGAWVDASGLLYLFGGQGVSGALNDLWRYDRATGFWTWIKGPSTANGVGVYGTQGLAADGNTPGSRRGSATFLDSNGELCLLGGANGVNAYNDLWTLALPEVPVISHVTVGNITSTSADLSAVANTFDQTVTPGFVVWSPSSPASVIQFTAPAVAGGSAVALTHTVTSLQAGTTYVVQVSASDVAGTGLSKPVTFTTSGSAGAPTVAFVGTSLLVSEASGTTNLEVRTNVPATTGFTIPVSILNPGTSGNATPGVDYTAPPTTLSFAPGQSSALISIPVVNDGVAEGNENIVLVLGAPTGGVTLGANSSFTLTISDDDVPASVVTSPTSLFSTVGSPATFTVSALGSNVTYQWKKNGAKITGATSSSYAIASTALTSAGTYSCDVKNSLIPVAASSDVAELFVVDTTPKTVVLGTGPTVNPSFTTSAAGPTGTTIDYVWQYNSGPISDNSPHLVGTGLKTLVISGLVSGDAGTYTCKVNKTGNTSLNSVSGSFTLIIPNAAPVLQSIAGGALPPAIVGCPYSYQILTSADGVTPNLLEKASSFTATPLSKGLTLNVTTGLISGTPVAATTTPVTLTITAKNPVNTSAPLTPTLSVLPFDTKVVGTFVATIARDTATSSLGGRFDLTVGTTGSYTAKVTFAGSTFSTTGHLVGVITAGVVDSATGTAIFVRKGLPSLSLAFTLAGNGVTGTFTDPLLGAPVPNDVAGKRNIWGIGGNVDLAYQSAYTFALPVPAASVGDLDVPQGSGYGSFTIGADGKITAVGKTADGQAFTVATITGPVGEMPFFAPFTTSFGSLMGTPAIDSSTGLFSSSSLVWTKNAAPVASKDMGYRQGFGPLTLTVTGGKYALPAAAPSANDVVLGLSNTDHNAHLTFTGPSLLPTDAPAVNFSIRNNTTTGTTQTVTMPKLTDMVYPNPNNATFTLSLTPGTYTGTMTIPNASATLARKVTFQGVLIQTAPATFSAPGFVLIPQLPQPGQTLTTSTVFSSEVEVGH